MSSLNDMPGWSSLSKFGEDVAKHAGVTTVNVWNATFSGRLPTGIEHGDPKNKFTDEDMNDFGERLKTWISAHPKEIATLFACIAAAPTAVLVTPAMVGMLGFGPLGPVAGSVAAAAQGALGPIAATSAFAILQSAGMGGYGLIVVQTIAPSGSLAGTCSAAAVSFLDALKEETCNDKKKE